MKISRSTVELIEISDLQNLDPIRVMLEDIGPGQGRINIECYGQSWATYWGGMGKETSVSDFVTGCDAYYIAGKVSGIPSSVFDPDGLKGQLKRELIDERRKRFITKYEARSRFDQIEDLSLPDNTNGLWYIKEMDDLMGEEWWYRLPMKENPDYTYLISIIKTVQSALREVAQ